MVLIMPGNIIPGNWRPGIMALLGTPELSPGSGGRDERVLDTALPDLILQLSAPAARYPVSVQTVNNHFQVHMTHKTLEKKKTLF